MSPQKELTLIHTYDNQGNLVVDVLIGAVRIRSDKDPEGVTVGAGFRYIDLATGKFTVEQLDLAKAVNEPSVQDFLRLQDWSRDNAATQLVRKFRLALGLGTSSSSLSPTSPSIPISSPGPIFPGGGGIANP